MVIDVYHLLHQRGCNGEFCTGPDYHNYTAKAMDVLWCGKNHRLIQCECVRLYENMTYSELFFKVFGWKIARECDMSVPEWSPCGIYDLISDLSPVFINNKGGAYYLKRDYARKLSQFRQRCDHCGRKTATWKHRSIDVEFWDDWYPKIETRWAPTRKTLTACSSGCWNALSQENVDRWRNAQDTKMKLKRQLRLIRKTERLLPRVRKALREGDLKALIGLREEFDQATILPGS